MTEPELTNDERLEAMLSDYVEGTLSLEERKEVEAHLAKHPELRDELEQMREDQKKLKSLNKTPAPEELGQKVEEIINRRSMGRFFSRRTLGDRVPFFWILLLALAVLIAIAFALWSSPTGSLRQEPKHVPHPSNEARESIPKPH
jgi:anti-sigma factor RsiW